MLFIVFCLYSCKDANTVSKEDRVSMFISGINKTDRSSLYTHLYSGASQYGNVDDAYWDQNTVFPEDSISYSISGLNISGNSGTATINSDTGGSFLYSGDEIYFDFVESDPEVWVISVISIDSDDDGTYDVNIFD